MASEWPSVPVSELEAKHILLVQDGNHGEYRPRADEFATTGVAFIRAADMADGRVLFESAAKINDVAFNRITKGIGQPGDVLLSHKGTVGKVAIAPMGCPAFVCSPQTTFWRTLNEAALDRSYLHSYLRGQHFHDQLATRSAETDMAPYVSLTSQRGLSVIVPPVAVQRGIGRVIQSIDDKIDVNRRMNATLEAMSRAIFKSWFVDFDPVAQKAAGKQPVGMDARTAALFPDAFEASEVGKVPEGWRYVSLESVCPNDDCVITGPFGSTLHASDYREQGTPLILVKHVVGGQFVDEETMPLVGEHKMAELFRYAVRDGDIVFTRVGAVGRSAYVHACHAGWLISGQMLRVRASKSSGIASRFLAQLYLEPSFVAMVEGHALGTTRPSLNTGLLKSFKFVMPSEQLMSAFASKVAADDEYRLRLRVQSRTLATLRDTLLPKLLSGELRIPDAEQAVEEAIT
jgi:type I restriction enzyme S subunit